MTKVESAFGQEDNGPFTRFINLGITNSLERITTQFNASPKWEERLPYHSAKHTLAVIRRTRSILTAIRQKEPTLVSSRDAELASFAAAFHDVAQPWYLETSIVLGQTMIARKKIPGLPEKNSIDLAFDFMQMINDRNGYIFAPGDFAVVQEAIEATIPSFDRETKTVVQPRIGGSSSLIAQAVALADLGACGMDGGLSLVNDTNTLFVEDNLDFAEKLHLRNFKEASQPVFRQRYLEWFEKQLNFARGRKANFIREISFLPHSTHIGVRELFTKFDESIFNAGKALLGAQGRPFLEIVSQISNTIA